MCVEGLRALFLPDLQVHRKLKTGVPSEIWLYIIYQNVGADMLERREGMWLYVSEESDRQGQRGQGRWFLHLTTCLMQTLSQNLQHELSREL